jgi:anaerobic dimethyl sulfoxide reductase subunit A
LTVALQIATANFGKRGGSTGSINSLLPGPRVGTLPSGPVGGEQPSIPVSRWPDAILEGRAGGYPVDIHAVYNVGSNFINQGSDIRKSIAAFEKLDFAVTHELFMTPTARYCDVIFPAASSLEREDIGLPWAGNYLLYKPQAVTPAGEARSDYDILWALADRLGFGDEYSQGRTTSEWITHFIEQSEIQDHQEFRRSGIYYGSEQDRFGLADFTADPQAHPLNTPSGKVEIASQRYQQETGFPPIPTWQAVDTDPLYPLSLITPKSLYRTHSQGSNIPWSQEKAQHALEMHPADAAARGICAGDRVRLINAQGEAWIPVRLSEDLTPGVVCLPEGVWVALNADGVDTAGSANMFTSTRGTEPGVACIMHAVRVEVRK